LSSINTGIINTINTINTTPRHSEDKAAKKYNLYHLFINFFTGIIIGIAVILCIFIYNKNMKQEAVPVVSKKKK
jgi:hypothetical protein